MEFQADTNTFPRFAKVAFVTLLLLFLVPISHAQVLNDDYDYDLGNYDYIEIESADDFDPDYSFIRNDLNHIMMNGDNWSKLRRLIAEPSRCPGGNFNIVQIGDSHIQPDIYPARVREILQVMFGYGGRGLVTPYKLAGTNGPSDYRITSSASIASKSKLVTRSWTLEQGITGQAVKFSGSHTDLTFSVIGIDNAFDRVIIFHAPHGGYDTAEVDGITLQGKRLSENAVEFLLPKVVTQVTMRVPCSSVFWGAQLTNTQAHGVVYNTIGNNGAQYASYLKVETLEHQIAILQPQLIILSMGGNDAVGKGYEKIVPRIDRMVKRLRAAMPEVKILITAPSEAFSRGRVDENRTKVRELIVQYGKENHVPVWDMYAVEGGKGGGYELKKNKLLSSDGVHKTTLGYRLDGDLLGEALLEQLCQ